MGQEQSQLAAAAGMEPAKLARRDPKTQTQSTTGSSWVPINPPAQPTPSRTSTSIHTTSGTNEKKRKRLSREGGDPGNGVSASATNTATESLEKQKSRKPAPTISKVNKSSVVLQNGLGISNVSTSPRKGPESASSVDSVFTASRELVTHAKKTVQAAESESSEEEDDVSINKEAQDLLAGFEAMDSDDDEDDLAGSPIRAKTTPNISNRPRPNPPPSAPNVPVTAQNFSKLPPTFLAAPNGHYPHPHQYANFPAGSPSASPPEDESPLTAHEQAQLKDEGRFTKMEQSFLKDALSEYCHLHDIAIELANDYVCGKARAGNIPADFWDEVCKSLPQRTKNSIQRAAKRVFRNNQKKGPWTMEEEDALADAYKRNPDQWAKVCEEVPGRSAEQCRDRWRNYTQNGTKLTRGPWTDEEERQFVDICKDMLAEARIDQENQRRFGRLVPERFDMLPYLNFTTISIKMKGARSRLHCRNKWHKLKKRPDIMEQIDAEIQRRLNHYLSLDTAKAPIPRAGLPVPPAGVPIAAAPAARPILAAQPTQDIKMVDAPAVPQTHFSSDVAPAPPAPISAPVAPQVAYTAPVAVTLPAPVAMAVPEPVRARVSTPVAAPHVAPATTPASAGITNDQLGRIDKPAATPLFVPNVKPTLSPDVNPTPTVAKLGGAVAGNGGRSPSSSNSTESKTPLVAEPANESGEISPTAENGRPARKKRKPSRIED